jgi:hypothetical protein
MSSASGVTAGAIGHRNAVLAGAHCRVRRPRMEIERCGGPAHDGQGGHAAGHRGQPSGHGVACVEFCWIGQ